MQCLLTKGLFSSVSCTLYDILDMPMFRRLPHAYADGVYEPSGKDRPNPIQISRAVMNGSTGQPSARSRTAFLVFFGEKSCHVVQ